MKKILFVAFIGLLSCSKEKTVTVTNTVHDTTIITVVTSGKVNADSLTTGLKIAYATTVADSIFPAASTDEAAPRLDSLFDRTYTSQPGSFVTIYPPNLSGHVQGYYVQIVGAKSYFKIDYPTAARGNGEGPNIDSTIAISLPAAIKGDTFHIKYAAYDAANRVSRPVIATVKLLPAVPQSATIDSLQGTWVINGNRYYENGYLNESWSQTWYYDYSRYYTCTNDVLVQSYSANAVIYYARRITSLNGFVFSGTKAIVREGFTVDTLDLSASTCADTVYTKVPALGEEYRKPTVGYTYDAPTRKITFYYSGDEENGNTSIYTDTYRISSISNKELILFYIYDNSYSSGYFTRYYKQ